MRRLYRALRLLLSGDPIRTTWTSGGVPRDVTTYHNPGETSAHWAKRHVDALTAALALYPPDAVATTVWTSGGVLRHLDSNNPNAIAAALASYPPDT